MSNTNVTQDENLGRGTSISFDELDSNLSSKGEIPTDKEAAKAMVLETDDLEKQEAQKPEEPEDSNSLKLKELDIADVNKALTQGKKITYKIGDLAQDIDNTAVFKHTVDGKEVDINLQELLNQYAGKVAYDKKFQELSTERIKYTKDKEITEKYIRDFYDIAQKGDALGAMEYLAQLSGSSPLEFKKVLKNQLFPEFEKWQQAPEETRKYMEMEEENSFLRRQRESESAKIQSQKAYQELESRISTVQKTFNVTDQDLVVAYDTLISKYSKEQVTPDLLNAYFTEKSALDKSESLIKNIDESLLTNDSVIDKVCDLILTKKYSDDEISDIISKTFSSKKKAKKSEEPTKKIESKKEEIQIKPSVPMRWDDLD